MEHQKLFEDILRRLKYCGYDVFSHEQGYIVQHLTDHDDVSRMRDLNELAELADLFEWREQWKTSQRLASGT